MTDVSNVALTKVGRSRKKLSAKKRRQMARRMINSVQTHVGALVFMDILEAAAHAIMYDVERQEVSLCDIFDEDGILEDAGEDYVEAAFNEVVLEFVGTRTASYDLLSALCGVFNRNMLEYFRLERQAQ
jgi:hypothetical protein